MAPTAITPVIAVPTVAPSDASLVGSVFCPDGGNAIELFGHATAGAGRLYLLRHLTGTTEWYLIDNDAADVKSIQVDAGAPAAAPGHFSGIWLASDLRGSARAFYVALLSGGPPPTLDRLFAAGRRL